MWVQGRCLVLLCLALQALGDNCPYDGGLEADDRWTVSIFNQTLSEPRDRWGDVEGMECRWVIEARLSDKRVRLKFPTFHLINSTVRKSGDCVDIYNGEAESLDPDQLIHRLCDRLPEPQYNSTGLILTVVFRQGEQGGQRWMTLNYTMVDKVEDDSGLSFLEIFFDDIFGYLIVAVIVICVLFYAIRFFRLSASRIRERLCLGNSARDPPEEPLEIQAVRRASLASYGSSVVTLEGGEGGEREGGLHLTVTQDSFLTESSTDPQAPPPDYTIAMEISTPTPAADQALVPSAPPPDGSRGPEVPPPSYESLFTS